MNSENKMSKIFNPVIQKIFIIFTWAGFTFTSHYYAKIFLSGSSHFAIDALILTSVQMLLASQVLLGSSEVVKLAFLKLKKCIICCKCFFCFAVILCFCFCVFSLIFFGQSAGNVNTKMEVVLGD